MPRGLLLIVSLLFVSSPHAAAAPATRQVAAMDTAPLRRLSDDGDPTAQVELARRMLLGKHATIDAPAAVALLEKASAAGNASAAYELALCYRLGQGVKADDARAEALLRQSADAGHAAALVDRLERELAATPPAGDPTPSPTEPATSPSIAPATRPADHASPAHQLLVLARRGEPTAQLAAARWANRGGGRAVGGARVESGEPMGWLLKAAAGDDDRAALSAVRLIMEGDGPIRADRSRAATLYRKLADRGLREAHELLAALAPESFVGLARQVSADRLFDDDRLIGSAVEVEGEVADVSAETLGLKLADGRAITVRRVTLPAVAAAAARGEKPLKVTLPEPGAAGDADPAVGRIARVRGVLEAPGRVAGLLVDIPEPRYQMRYDVQSPQVVRGGRNRRFVVDAEFRNVSRQRVAAVTLNVRLLQPGTGNDETETVELENLNPGETRKFRVPFDLYDYRDRASNEKPHCEVTVQQIKW